MKAGVSGFAPLAFRTLSMWLGLPMLAAVLVARGVSFRIGRADWKALALLTVTNMLIWHVLAIQIGRASCRERV